MVSAKAPTHAAAAMFARHAAGTLDVEIALARGVAATVGPGPGRARCHPTLANHTQLHQLPAGHGARWQLHRGTRGRSALLLDLRPSGCGVVGPRLARSALPTMDRHLCRRGIRFDSSPKYSPSQTRTGWTWAPVTMLAHASTSRSPPATSGCSGMRPGAWNSGHSPEPYTIRDQNRHDRHVGAPGWQNRQTWATARRSATRTWVAQPERVRTQVSALV